MIIKVSSDKEKARSILNLIIEREKFVKQAKNNEFSTIICENYYEIIKELCTAIILTEGLKSIGDNSHKDLIEHMKKYGLKESEIILIDDLRIRRNKSSYEGKPIERIYLDNNKENLLKLIEKLKNMIRERLK